jgi:hypothetical protein
MAQTDTSTTTEVPEQRELVRRGQAVPIDPETGAPKLDAPQVVLGPGCHEATAINLAKQEGSPESRMLAHVGGHGVGGRVAATNSDTTATESGTWPKRHADLDAIAEEHGLTFSQDGLTIDAKIEELKLMEVSPPPKG